MLNLERIEIDANDYEAIGKISDMMDYGQNGNCGQSCKRVDEENC